MQRAGPAIIVPGAFLMPIVRISDVWFRDQKFGVTLKLRSAIVYQDEPSLDEFVGLATNKRPRE